MAQGRQGAVPLEEKLRPERSALVVVDMLNDFVHPEGKAVTRGGRDLSHIEAAIPAMRRLLEGARAAGAGVVHVQHTALRAGASDSAAWVDARARAPYSAEDICLEGTWGHDFLDGLGPADGEPVVRKHRYSGFAGTNLELLLRSAEATTVVVCGASTNVCVEATARTAFDHDFFVVWPSDASGSWGPELHEAALASAGRRYAEVCRTDDVLAAWQA